MRLIFARCLLLLTLFGVPAVSAGATPSPGLTNPTLLVGLDPEAADRESLRKFLEEGPALLLPAPERARIAALPLSQALVEAKTFLVGDPLPATPENELAIGIDRRQRLVWSEGLSLRDVRGLLLFLRGEPRERTKIDCGDTYQPLEIWSYGTVENPRNAVVYRPRADAYFVLWRPTESKRALYMPEMEYYLEQWEDSTDWFRVSGRTVCCAKRARRSIR